MGDIGHTIALSCEFYSLEKRLSGDIDEFLGLRAALAGGKCSRAVAVIAVEAGAHIASLIQEMLRRKCSGVVFRQEVGQ